MQRTCTATACRVVTTGVVHDDRGEWCTLLELRQVRGPKVDNGMRRRVSLGRRSYPNGRTDSARSVLRRRTAGVLPNLNMDCKGGPAARPSPAFAILLDDFETKPAKHTEIVKSLWTRVSIGPSIDDDERIQTKWNEIKEGKERTIFYS